MKVLNIKIFPLPTGKDSFWMKLLFYLCIPFLLIFVILLLIGWGIYSGISSIISAVKEDFFGIKDKTNIKTSKNILFENEQFKLKKKTISLMKIAKNIKFSMIFVPNQMNTLMMTIYSTD